MIDFDTFADSYQPTARAGDPLTSHQAAASVRLRDVHLQVYRLLSIGPATDEELITRAYGVLTISDSGMRTRRSELVRAGWVQDSGQRGQTRSGRACIVWEVVRRPIAERG